MDNSNGGARTLACPFYSETELRAFGRNSLRCEECGGVLGSALQETLYPIVALPDAAGGHACECGHPEMRHLPEGVYRCPGSPRSIPKRTDAAGSTAITEIRHGSPATRLAKWEDPSDRLDYYRGHRGGYEARLQKTRLVEASQHYVMPPAS